MYIGEKVISCGWREGVKLLRVVIVMIEFRFLSERELLNFESDIIVIFKRLYLKGYFCSSKEKVVEGCKIKSW